MPDFTTLTVAELAAFAVDHQNDMGAGGLTADEIEHEIEGGRAVVEARENAFAIIQVKPGPDGKQMSHLWLLYVAPEARGRGIGHRFMRLLLNRYSQDYHMTLYCDGARRRAFFGRLGFVVQKRDGEMRHMTTDRDWRRY